MWLCLSEPCAFIAIMVIWRWLFVWIPSLGIVATHPLSLSSHTHAPHTGHPLIHLVMMIVNIFVHDDDIWLKVLIMPVWLNAPTLESRSGLADDITQTFLTHVISLSADTSKHPHTQTSSDFQPAFIDDAPQNFSHYMIVSALNIWTSAQRWSSIMLWLNSINKKYTVILEIMQINKHMILWLVHSNFSSIFYSPLYCLFRFNILL